MYSLSILLGKGSNSGFLSYHYRFLPQHGGADPGQWDVLYLLPEDGHTLHGGSSVLRQTPKEVSRISEKQLHLLLGFVHVIRE